MRVLHLADPHIYLSGPRAEECRRVIDWIALNAREAKPTLIIISGDIFERRSSPQERIYFAELLCALSDIAPVYIINGNHDDRDDLRLFRREYGWIKPIEIILEPTVLKLQERQDSVSMAFLPWPDLSRLAKSGAGDSIAARREAARGALLDIVRGFRNDPGIAPDKPSLLIAHLSVTGASMDSGQPVCGGEELALTADELLESGAAGVALGHIHLRQQMKGAFGRPVWYSGAPFRGSFGEARGTKGGLIWDWNGKTKTWEVSPWEIPARSMVLIERTWIPAEDGALEPVQEPLAADDVVRAADVRARITYPAEFREAMRAAMTPVLDAVRAVAHAVTVEERPIIVSRTRCVELAAARTPFEKVQAWAQAVGAEVPDGAAAKLAILEAGVTS